jgi:uncharacterized protein with HEPN domain
VECPNLSGIDIPRYCGPRIIALRNILVHEYFGLNMHQVWTMARRDVPKLEEQVRDILTRVASDAECGS